MYVISINIHLASPIILTETSHLALNSKYYLGRFSLCLRISFLFGDALSTTAKTFCIFSDVYHDETMTLLLFTLEKRFQVGLTSCLQKKTRWWRITPADGTCTLFLNRSLTILTPRTLRVGCIVMRRWRCGEGLHTSFAWRLGWESHRIAGRVNCPFPRERWSTCKSQGI